MADPVLLVGINSDVGFEVGRQLVESGEVVLASARTAEQCAEISAKIPGLKEIFPLELSDAGIVLETLRQRIGESALAGVIACASAGGLGPLETVPLTTARTSLEVNAVSTIAIYQACMPALRRTRGRVVLVSSFSGKINQPFLGVYQASKFTLESLADTMRMEGSLSGVKVVVVEPGGINTKMVHRMVADVKRHVGSLSEFERQTYGDLYNNFIAMSENADWSQLSTAAYVAENIIAAYREPDPEPRYVVGADAEYLLGERRARNDREMDVFAMEIYGVRPLTEERYR